MGDKLRVATIGVGYFSRFHYDAWRRMDDVDLVALCNRTEDGARATAEEHGIGQVFTDVGTMLDTVDVDLVDIITPPPTHRPFIEQAARHGVAAICQKPFCETLEDAEAAVSVAEAAGIPHVSIEIRQDLVDTEDGAERWATILDDALRDILADPELYQVWQSI